MLENSPRGPTIAPKLKVSIRPLARPPQPPPDFEERAWTTLQAAVRAIYNKTAVPGNGSMEELYRLVQALCLAGLDSQLAQRLCRACDVLVSARLSKLSVGSAGGDDLALLGNLQAAWENHCEAMRTICALFAHLDRTHILMQRYDACGASSNRGTLWDRGLQLFRAQIDAQPQLRDRVCRGVLDLVDAERIWEADRGAAKKEKVNDRLLGSLVDMLVKTDLYSPWFESPLLDRTASFYRAEAADLSARFSLAEYLAHCERRLNEERQRCECGRLERGSLNGLLTAVRAELLQKPGEELLANGFFQLVAGHCVDDLERLFRLFTEVEELPMVKKIWIQSIKHRGNELMEKAEDPEGSKALVSALFDLKDRLTEIHVKAFRTSSEFGIALKDAFEGFVNAGVQNLPAKLLARYVDDFMRDERPGGDANVELVVERVLGIFRFIAAKDAFEAFYKKDLAKRLLQQTSSSADAEARMVQKLREECGAGYTSKIEGMFRDIELSKELMTAFLERPEVQKEATFNASSASGGGRFGNLEFSVNVVATGLWPTQPPSVQTPFPEVPRRLQDLFSSFYSARFVGRSLRWSPQLGQCTLRATFDGGVRKELVASIFQTLICLLFNTSTALTCNEIADATQIPKAELKRVLASLALHKHVKVLLKQPFASKSREVSDDDVFTVNAEFNHKLYRVAIPQLSSKEHQDEETGVEQRVFEDRQHEVDAVIVRTMKVKKRSSHQDLLADVFRAISFPIGAADVKARIESLIEREYLERDQERQSSYAYLA